MCTIDWGTQLTTDAETEGGLSRPCESRHHQSYIAVVVDGHCHDPNVNVRWRKKVPTTTQRPWWQKEERGWLINDQ
jgi:hypothetical protein